MSDSVRKILEDVKSGDITIDDAVLKMKTEPFKDLGFAKVDLHRKLRQGIPEVIYGAGKTPDEIAKIAETLLDHGQYPILITRLSKEAASETIRLGHFRSLNQEAVSSGEKDDNIKQSDAPLKDKITQSSYGSAKKIRNQAVSADTDDKSKDREYKFEYLPSARIGIVGDVPKPNGLGKIVVATGGTSDIPVAEEAAITAEVFGNEVTRLYDVGVAGVHRLFSHLDDLMSAKVIIAIAGMEGALASVIGGLTDCPVIAVPTSIGYGASFGGLSALLSMLNSCASGVSVVNIDNGFGAGYLAGMINHMGVER